VRDTRAGMPALLALPLLLAACAHPAAPPATSAPAPLNAKAVTGVADSRLQQLFSDQWEDALARSPLTATSLGDHRYDDRLDAHSPAAGDASRAQRDRFLARARAIPVASLSPSDATTLELFVETLEASKGADVCHSEEWGLSARNNATTVLGSLSDLQPILTEADTSNYVARVRAMPTYVDEDIANLALGVKSGRTPNATSVSLVIGQVDALLAQPVAEWPVALPLAAHRPGVSADAEQRFHDALLTTLEADVKPALGRYRAFLRDTLLSVSRGPDRDGAWALPDGDACYAAQVLVHTTLASKPSDLHQVGLDELERIHAEMRVLGQSLFGISDLPTLIQKLRTDPSLRFTSAAEILQKANANLAAAKAKLPVFFGHLPVADCQVRPIPDYEAPYTYIGYYHQLVPGEQPGYYYVNTYQPETRTTFEASVLAFHVSIPGHHLQIAIGRELPGMPAFRNNLEISAFQEGWALYTERLADEMGLYATDLDRLGMLSFDSWRASRLVVDTGIHAMRWDRAKAEAFMLANTALAPNNIHNEVDRYITWPGQALAYKSGQIVIRDLRAESEAKLGDRFSLPAFHDVVLGGGSVTLPMLQRRVRSWQDGVLSAR